MPNAGQSRPSDLTTVCAIANQPEKFGGQSPLLRFWADDRQTGSYGGLVVREIDGGGCQPNEGRE